MSEKLAGVLARRLGGVRASEEERKIADVVLFALNLSEAQAASLMDGSAVVVPREAGPVMLTAAAGYVLAPSEHSAKQAWGAMLAAASQHEETKG